MDDKLQILIVDDESIVGKRLGPALCKMGADVEVFEDPHDVLRRIQEKCFDIIVTDIRMDDIDGMEILEKVRSRSKRTKVIIMTGYATIEVAREAFGKGAFDFLAKPFKPNDLRNVILRAAAALGYKGLCQPAPYFE